MKKKNTTALGLHLVPGSADGILTYSDGIADISYESLKKEPGDEPGAFQSDINKELKEAIQEESDWYEG